MNRCGPAPPTVTPGAINPLEHLGLIGEALKGIGINPKLRRRPKGDGEGEGDAREDVEQEAVLALCRTAETWPGGTWSAYAVRSIRNAVIDMLRKERRWPQQLPKVFYDRTKEEIAHKKILQYRPTNDTLEAADATLDAQALLAGLPDREKQVIVLTYGLDGDGKRTQAETARLLGISQQKVSRLKEQAMARMSQAAGVQEPADDQASLSKSRAVFGGKKCRCHVE